MNFDCIVHQRLWSLHSCIPVGSCWRNYRHIRLYLWLRVAFDLNSSNQIIYLSKPHPRQNHDLCIFRCTKPRHLICFKQWTAEMVMNIIVSAINLKKKHRNTHNSRLVSILAARTSDTQWRVRVNSQRHGSEEQFRCESILNTNRYLKIIQKFIPQQESNSSSGLSQRTTDFVVSDQLLMSQNAPLFKNYW